MRCPYCGAEIDENDTFCGECGRPIIRDFRTKKRFSIRKIIYIVITIFVVLFILYIFSSGSFSSKPTPTITPGPTAPVAQPLRASVEILNAPSVVGADRPFEIVWRVKSSVETTINHTAIHYGPESRIPPLDLQSYLYISDIMNGAVPADFSTKITIKNVGDYGKKLLYFRAHAIIENGDYWSDEKSIIVQSVPVTSTSPTINVISYPVKVKGGTTFTIRWVVFGGSPGMIRRTAILWGFNSGGQNIADYPRRSIVQGGYSPAGFSVDLNAPSGGTIYFRVNALVDDTDIYSPEYKITIY